MRVCPACNVNPRASGDIRADFVAQRAMRRRYAALVPVAKPSSWQDGELVPPGRLPMLPPLLNGIDPRTIMGNERTFTFYTEILEGGGFSQEKAKELIANEIRDTKGSDEPLLLDPIKGLDGPRAVIEKLSRDLGLDFVRHPITVSHRTKRLPPVSFTGYLTMRSVRAVARCDAPIRSRVM